MNHIQTIRENAERLSRNSTNDPRGCGDAILAALAELERTHYTAEDVADASAKGFRDGVASVTAEQEPFAHFVYFPDQQRGEFAHDLDDLCEDMTNDENHEVTPLFTAAPVAQQPQAEPLCEDEGCPHSGTKHVCISPPQAEVVEVHRCTGAGDTALGVKAECQFCTAPPQARPADARRACPFCSEEWVEQAQQPQAEALPKVQIVNCDTCKHAKNDCDDYPCNRCGFEFGDGPFNRWEAPQQAEAVRWGVDWGTHGDRTCVSIIKKHADGKMEVVATEYEPERKAAPQQAEAVPSDVVCDKDPQGCWNVRCQLGKVCKNAALAAAPKGQP